MNILQLNWVMNPGGQDRHVIDLSNYLVSRDHHVVVGSQGGKWVDRLRCPHIGLPFADCWPSPTAKLFTPKGFKGLVRVLGALRRTIKRERIQLVHCHGVPEVVFTSWIRNANVPLVHTHHGCKEEDWPWHARHVRKRCDRYIGVSEFTSQRLIKNGCPAQHVSTINYGISYGSHSPRDLEEAANLRKRWTGGRNLKVVVTIARLHYQKGIDVLIRAIPKIVQHVPDAFFVVVGGGPERDNLTSLIQRKGLQRYIQLVGHQENVLSYLLAGDLFCLPSRWEGLPLSIAEAYRAGLPDVASAVAGTPEIVEEGVTGWLVQAESDAQLSDRIIRALMDEDRLATMRCNAHAYGHSKRFDPEFVHTRIERLYAELLDSNKSARSESTSRIASST